VGTLVDVSDQRIRRRVIVHGRVQGVFFRDSVRERARSRAVHGRVRNRSDGTVEVVLEGPSDAVDALVGFCETGPRGARVSHVEVTDEAPEGLDGFEVG
jgi:acylphosphatase